MAATAEAAKEEVAKEEVEKEKRVDSSRLCSQSSRYDHEGTARASAPHVRVPAVRLPLCASQGLWASVATPSLWNGRLKLATSLITGESNPLHAHTSSHGRSASTLKFSNSTHT